MNLSYLYTSFDGRINRQPYWLGTIILVVVMLVIIFAVGFAIGIPDTIDFRFRLVTFILQLVFLYPSAALMVKRLHDRNRPTYFAAFILVPVILKGLTDLIGMTGDPFSATALDYILNGIIFIVAIWFFIELGILRGTVGPNQYGPDPLGAAPAR
jgi:uncharacterized membrane protein YhaH (DUF805 family)